MPKFSRYLIKPNAPFHIGERGVGLEETSITVHSDTLFGAICWSWKLLFGEDELIKLLNQFKNGNPPFLLSSTFPFIGDIMILPKPLQGLGSTGLEKRVRHASFVTHSIFQSLVEGNALQPGNYEVMKGDSGNIITTLDECRTIKDLVKKGRRGPIKNSKAQKDSAKSSDKSEEDRSSKDKMKISSKNSDAKADTSKSTSEQVFKCSDTISAWITGDAPRVTLDRDTRRSDIYYAGDVRFMEGSGLYFLVDFRDENYKSMLKGALRLLGDEGLGGERSSGRGLFSLDEIAEKEMMHIGSDDGDCAVLLSLYRPRKEDASTLQSSVYSLITRRGWTAGKSDMRKKSVRMLSEGSVIPFDKKRILGCMENVSGEGTRVGKQIISYGLAFQVPARLG